MFLKTSVKSYKKEFLENHQRPVLTGFKNSLETLWRNLQKIC
jgi:hypothetical protein